MRYFNKTIKLFDNYVVARWQQRPSTALFWYLPEPPNITTKEDVYRYKTATTSPLYLMDYRQKLKYPLVNNDGIIVLPYGESIGLQVNPEAAFQYALGLHDQFYLTNDSAYLDKFWQYVAYFISKQSQDGLWPYEFDWYGSEAPWYSALAQSRGAAVMLRAWLLSKQKNYLDAAKQAIAKFTLSTKEGGFLHPFSSTNSPYFEEYPQTPTGVINGFMASLISIWELKHWTKEIWLDELWRMGIESLERMLPYYSNGWWSLYDLDPNVPIVNVNSPRYHLLEIHYLQVLSLLSDSPKLMTEHEKRQKQYKKRWSKWRALSIKLVRKILYK